MAFILHCKEPVSKSVDIRVVPPYMHSTDAPSPCRSDIIWKEVYKISCIEECISEREGKQFEEGLNEYTYRSSEIRYVQKVWKGTII